MNILIINLIFLFIAGLTCFFGKQRAKWIALAATTIAGIMGIYIFSQLELFSFVLNLHTGALSSGIYLACAILTLLITLFSFRFMENKPRLNEYYTYLLFSLMACAGALFASDYLVLMVFWGLLALTLYLLVGIGENSGAPAKKALMIVGGSDVLFIIGVAIIWAYTGSLQIGATKIMLNHPLAILSFACLVIPAFAKAGAMPFHSWIPDSAENTPATVMAYLPAALDKLLGIYLLFRLVVDVFVVIPNSYVSIIIMLIGALTLVLGVMAALVQHNFKKLLAYHAVSQVGYMILGIGSGIPLAIAGGLFHMLNNAIYKSLLFLSGAAIEKQNNTTELEKLGGLAKTMPITFACTVIAAFSISGIPPFNGFVSKWMIYQGLLELSLNGPWWIIWITCAMFGSALTLASFVKILHAIFLGQPTAGTKNTKEANIYMLIPIVLLALLCILFGVFNFIPLNYFILKAMPINIFIGLFSSSLATLIILLAIILGLAIYFIGSRSGKTLQPNFIGGEILEEKEIKVTGNQFYNTIKEWGPLSGIYACAQAGYFNFYALISAAANACAKFLKRLHSGQLQTYILWLLFGWLILLYIFLR